MKHQTQQSSIINDVHLGLKSILPKQSGINVRLITKQDGFIKNGNLTLYQNEILLTGKMSEKRLNDFTAGRLAAKDALSQLGIDSFPLLIGSNRAPLWPKSIVGSISHSKDICISAVNFRKNNKSIGVDIESTKPLTSEILQLICDPAEIIHLENLESSNQGAKLDNAKIIFSIKESIFKCLNPLLNCWIDFKEMQVTIDPINKSYIANASSKNTQLMELKTIKGNWFSNDYFHTSSCWL